MLQILDMYDAYQALTLVNLAGLLWSNAYTKCSYRIADLSHLSVSLPVLLPVVSWFFSKSSSYLLQFEFEARCRCLWLFFFFYIVSETLNLTGSSQGFLPDDPGATSSNSKCIHRVWIHRTVFEPRSQLSVVMHHALGLLLGTEAKKNEWILYQGHTKANSEMQMGHLICEINKTWDSVQCCICWIGPLPISLLRELGSQL